MEVAIQMIDQVWQLLVRVPWSMTIKILLFVPVSAALLAPMPVSVFIALVPNGFLLFSGFEYYSKVYAWCAVSISVSMVVFYFVGNRFLRST